MKEDEQLDWEWRDRDGNLLERVPANDSINSYRLNATTYYRMALSGPMALWMLAGFLLLTVLDVGTTLACLSRGATEGNPLMRQLLIHGELTFWIAKLSVAAVAVVILETAYLRNRRLGFRIITGVYLFQALVVLNNLAVIERLS